MSETKSTTKTIYSKKILKKRLARLMAVQCIYSINTPGIEQNIDKVIYNLIKSDFSSNLGAKLNESDEPFLINLTRITFEEQDKLVDLLEPFLSEGWRFNRLAKLVQAILLVSAAELKSVTALEPAMVINEYLEIAKIFNHSGEVSFINKVLDQIANKAQLK